MIQGLCNDTKATSVLSLKRRASLLVLHTYVRGNHPTIICCCTSASCCYSVLCLGLTTFDNIFAGWVVVLQTCNCEAHKHEGHPLTESPGEVFFSISSPPAFCRRLLPLPQRPMQRSRRLRALETLLLGPE